jgi:hypothetical protein
VVNNILRTDLEGSLNPTHDETFSIHQAYSKFYHVSTCKSLGCLLIVNKFPYFDAEILSSTHYQFAARFETYLSEAYQVSFFMLSSVVKFVRRML